MEDTQQSFIGPGRLCREVQLHMITTNCRSFVHVANLWSGGPSSPTFSLSPKKKTPDRRLPERLQPGKYQNFFSFIQYTSCILFDVTLHNHVRPAGQICAFSRRFFPKVKAKSCLGLQSREESLHFHWTLRWCYIHVKSVKAYIKLYYAIFTPWFTP